MAPDRPDAPAIAHLLRRTGFGPAPGEVETFASFDEALESALAGAADDGADMPDPVDDDTDGAVVWWLRRLRRSPNPLHDKLVLFWHGHLTSSADKASADMMARQHNLLRRHATGNVRELLHAIIRDAAMLIFLDGAGSQADAPNENLAREFMELFALGRGNYTEVDVRAGARALAGFTVDWESEAVGFDEEAAVRGRLTVLGVTDSFDADRFVDVVCEQPACAAFIATKLHRFLAGSDPSEARRDELAGVLRDHDFAVMPLVEAILRHDEFAANRLNRPRFPIEWFLAAHHAMGTDVDAGSIWALADMGQMPLYPPNVAGWPVGPQWIGTGRQLLKTSLVIDAASGESSIFVDFGETPAERATGALRHCGLFEASVATTSALEAAARQVASVDGGDLLLLALTLASPEAACA